MVLSIQDRRVMGIIIGTLRQRVQSRFVTLYHIIRRGVGSGFGSIFIGLAGGLFGLSTFIVVLIITLVTYIEDGGACNIVTPMVMRLAAIVVTV